MVSNLTCGVDDAFIVPNSPSLIDSPTLEADNAENRLSLLMGEFDREPESIEVECDDACDALADAFPGSTVSVTSFTSRIRIRGEWNVSTEWSAMAHGTVEYFAKSDSPAQAVAAVLDQHRKATAPVRSHPEHRQLVAKSFESFGRIDPATAADFLELVEQHHGASDFILVEPCGLVRLATGAVEGSEAFAIGSYVALHNLNLQRKSDELDTRIIIEPCGTSFRAALVLPSGERIDVAGVCASEPAAREWARMAILSRRSTLPASSIVASESSAA